MTLGRNLGRRKFIQLGLGAAALPALGNAAWAQAYPSRPITLVVFLPAGAIPDLIGRLIGDGLSQRLGQPVIIENRPGAGGNLALQAVARAPADGHTLLLHGSSIWLSSFLQDKVPYDALRDFAPVTQATSYPYVIATHPAMPFATFRDMLTAAKAKPSSPSCRS